MRSCPGECAASITASDKVIDFLVRHGPGRFTKLLRRHVHNTPQRAELRRGALFVIRRDNGNDWLSAAANRYALTLLDQCNELGELIFCFRHTDLHNLIIAM